MAMLASWEWTPPKRLYQFQVDRTKEKAQRVHREIERLQCLLGESAETAVLQPEQPLVQEQQPPARCRRYTPEWKKLEFLTSQMSVYEQITQIIVTQAATFELDDLRTRQPMERAESVERFYQAAAQVLRLMETSFDRVLLVPVEEFKRLCNNLVVKINTMFFERYPAVTSGGVALGVISGGVVGCLCGAHLTGGAIMGVAVGGAIVGGAVVFIAVVVLAGFLALADGCFQGEQGETDSACKRTQLQAMINKFRERELPVQELLELGEVFEECFTRSTAGTPSNVFEEAAETMRVMPGEH